MEKSVLRSQELARRGVALVASLSPAQQEERKALRALNLAPDTEFTDDLARDVLFRAVHGISVGGKSTPRTVTAGDVLVALRLINFRPATSLVQVGRLATSEAEAACEFQLHFGKVLDMLRNDVEGRAMLVWDDRRDRHPLSASELYDIVRLVEVTGTNEPPTHSKAMTKIRMALSSSLQVVRDSLPSSQHLPLAIKLAADITESRAFFETLFLHFEANTESGDQDALLSPMEVVEMLQVLGFHPTRDLGLPSSSTTFSSTASESSTVQGTALHALSDRAAIQWSSEGEPGYVGLGESGTRQRGTTAPQGDVRARNGRTSPDPAPQIGHTAPPPSPFGKICAFFKARRQEDLDRGAFTGLCIRLMNTDISPKDAKDVAAYQRQVQEEKDAEYAREADDMEANAPRSRQGPTEYWVAAEQGPLAIQYFARTFRHRMCQLYEAAEGMESSMDASQVAYDLAVAVFFPLGALVYLRSLIASELAGGPGFSSLVSKIRANSIPAVLSFLIGCWVWSVTFVTPLVILTSTRGLTQCLTVFEAVYPAAIIVVWVLASATYQGYNVRDVRPSRFRLYRIEVQIRTWQVCERVFTSGVDRYPSAYQLITETNQIVRVGSRRRAAKGIRRVLEYVYLHQLKPKARLLWILLTAAVAIWIGILPGMYRARILEPGGEGIDDPSSNKPRWDESCRSFVPEHESYFAVTYMIFAPLCTLGVSVMLMRMYIQFADIARSWAMFDSLHNPVRGRRRKQRSFWLQDTQSMGRLNGYIDLRRPENVRGWSKIRLYLVLRFADEVQGVQIFLAYTILLLFGVVCTGGMLTLLPFLFNRTIETIATTFMLAIVSMVFAFPILAILIKGVQINQIMDIHRAMLSRERYQIQEDMSSCIAAFGEGSDAVCSLRSARQLITDLLELLRESDQPLKVLGIPLTMALVRTIVIAMLTTLGGTAAKAFNSYRLKHKQP